MANSRPVEPPPDIPDFDLIRPIGSGGFGRVWLATNRTTGQIRAVKVVPLRHTGRSDPAGREINSLVRLETHVRVRHANLMDIHHVGQTPDCLYYVMDVADDLSGSRASLNTEYTPATLQNKLENALLSTTDCLRSARELLAGLAFLHGKGMVHRDVKPANCLVVDGVLRLADFGLLTCASPFASRLGTHAYMPPDGRMDQRADIYATGLVIYEMISGHPASAFPSLGSSGPRVANDPILQHLNRLALRACDADPDRRFRDARTMLEQLEPPAGQASTGSIPSARPLLRRPAVPLFLVMAALLGWRLAFRSTPVDTPRISVNFITEPHEATIVVDGQQLADVREVPYRTPCTVPDLIGRPSHVVFQHDVHGRLDVGEIDFRTAREVTARFAHP